ncbi:MAG: hypothetical protein ABJE47_24950 [bacterium]
MTLLPIHIIAGAIAIPSGFVALYASKGATLHRRSGMVFVVAMFVMAGLGAFIAAMKHNPGSVNGGVLTFYMVATGLLTVRRRGARSLWLDIAGVVVVAAACAYNIKFAFDAMASPTGRINGVPAAPGFVFAAVALLAMTGDIRMIVARGIHGRQRIARHLWRMGVALLIATFSFFLGQAKVIPKPIRIYPVLMIPIVLVLVLTLYWWVRVSFTAWRGGGGGARATESRRSLMTSRTVPMESRRL